MAISGKLAGLDLEGSVPNTPAVLLTDDIDQAIREIIRTGSEPLYDWMIRDRSDPAFFYHLSSLRRGVLCWYPFHRDWKCLELGAGFGSLTGALLQSMHSVVAVEPNRFRRDTLAERYGDMSLRVFERFPIRERFNCIVLKAHSAKRERLSSVLSRMFESLCDDGVALLGFENRNGLHRHPYATNCFTLSGEPLFSSEEIRRMAADAGFKDQFFYYILPDVLFPQAVFSEKVFPDQQTERFFFHHAFHSFPNNIEAEYRAALKDKTFGERADWIIVELRKRSYAGPRVTKAYLSCDRGREHSFIIRFLDSGYVEKQPVFPEGRDALAEQYNNLNEMKGKGLQIVPQEMDGACIRMPFVQKPSLLWHLRDHPQETEWIFEKLRTDILRSTDLARDGILKKGFIDMVPFNCFYENGELIYYDQEFSELNCQLGYILFRAIYYTYLHLPELEKVLPRERLIRKYGIGPAWTDYEKRESLFVGRNRNFDLYYRFWEHRTY